jgi:hypothetical protein
MRAAAIAAAVMVGLPVMVRADEEANLLAARIEGYLGYARLVAPNSPDADGFSGGGVGSVALNSGPFSGQLDFFGDRADYDRGVDGINTIGVGAHLGLRDSERGAVAFSTAWNRGDLEDPDVDTHFYRVGGEVEGYLGILTAGANAGLVEIADSRDDDYYARGFLRVYPTENLRLEVLGGVVDRPDDGNDPTDIARAELAFRLPESPLAVFGRWEATFDAIDSHQAVLGVRLLLDGNRSLLASDRSTFFDGCTLVHSLSRSC